MYNYILAQRWLVTMSLIWYEGISNVTSVPSRTNSSTLGLNANGKRWLSEVPVQTLYKKMF